MTKKSTNVAKAKHIAKRKVVTPAKTAGDFDFDQLQEKKDPIERSDFIREFVQNSQYVCLSDLFINVERGARAVLARLETQINVEAKRGMGVRTWRIRMVVDKNGQEPKSGQVITWVRQRHNRLDYGQGEKIGADKAMELKRRGYGHLLTEEAEVTLDADGCFECTFPDATDLLSKNGIYYLTFDPADDRSNDSPINPGVKRISKAGTCNWNFVEVPPGWEDKVFKKKSKRRHGRPDMAKRTQKRPDALDPINDKETS